jgi:NAD(P)-dependent dehydrogenase (short-subunit alcohol dehydrogenase family)
MGGWLEGQAALVTGGATELGAPLVERFLEEGASAGVLDAKNALVANVNARRVTYVTMRSDWGPSRVANQTLFDIDQLRNR